MDPKDPWMQTYSGRKFHVLNPRAEDIDIEDIAHALSLQCRYGGHCRGFYSVAEHSVFVSQFVPAHLKLTALLHDAQETYLSDVIRPVKLVLPEYKVIEDRLARSIAEKFGTVYPLPYEVKYADNAILTDEREQIMAPMDVSPEEWGNPLPALGVRLPRWDPRWARSEFLTRFHILHQPSMEKAA